MASKEEKEEVLVATLKMRMVTIPRKRANMTQTTRRDYRHMKELWYQATAKAILTTLEKLDEA